MTRETTHFGYETVPRDQKAGRVKGVFDSVASRYDLMNDLMSVGLHRVWKRFALEHANARLGQCILDLAGGTGDLAEQLLKSVGSSGRVVLADINAAMLAEGRRRLIDKGAGGNLSIAQVDAENLPFQKDTFDCITIAFGLRNVTDQQAALESMFSVLKPGGKLVILEFSRPAEALQPVYDWYSFKMLPLMGELVAKDADSYRYLAESIRTHPDQETLRGMMSDAGFDRCRFFNLTGGVVALHTGLKL